VNDERVNSGHRSTRHLNPTPEDIRAAAELLGRDELVALPTETVYGLAGNAFREDAALRIFSAKERPAFDPLIVHVSEKFLLDSRGPLPALAAEGILSAEVITWPHADRITALMRAFWPGPLTLLLPKGNRIPDLVTSGLPAVGIRMPAHPVFQAVLSETGFPLAAPSANRFGRISPTTAAHVEQELAGRIAAILDGGPCAVGVESTILGVDPCGSARLLRPGQISAARLEEILGARVIAESGVVEKNSAALAPGMSDQHYAPGKPLYLIPGPLHSRQELDAHLERARLTGTPGLLTQAPPDFETGIHVSLCLSATGSCEEAARNLFSMLRILDQDPSISHMIADLPPMPRQGLSSAIADRLNRASINKPLLTGSL
jgi:L-threonylcarbamoyladenylate synthase